MDELNFLTEGDDQSKENTSKNKKEIKPDPQVNKEGVSNEGLIDIVKKLSEELNELKKNSRPIGDDTKSVLRELISEMKGQDKVITKNQFTTYDNIDPNDRLEVPVVYYNWSGGYVIADDKKDGRAVQTPFGNVISFEYFGSIKTQKGKEMDILNISKYTCRSKKEEKFLDNHSFFGIKFFKDVETSKSVDLRKANKMIKFAESLNNTEPYRIAEMYQREGFGSSGDLRQMRLTLASVFAEREISMENEKASVMLSENQKEKELRFAKDNT